MGSDTGDNSGERGDDGDRPHGELARGDAHDSQREEEDQGSLALQRRPKDDSRWPESTMALVGAKEEDEDGVGNAVAPGFSWWHRRA